MKEKPSHEIERKFLVRELPRDLANYRSNEISQGYLVSLDDGLQVRLRKSGDRHSLTFKRGTGNVREEREVELNGGAIRSSLACHGRQTPRENAL